MIGTVYRRRYFFVFVAIFSLLVSILSPLQILAVTTPGDGNITTPGVPPPDPHTYSGMNPDQRAQSYALYYGILGCVTDIKEILNDDVISGGFDGAVNSYLYSFYIDASDGKSECQTAEKKAVALWGYKTLDAALLDWGYKAPSGSDTDWTASNPGITTGVALRNRVYGGNQPAMDGPALYLYWYKTTVSACELSGAQPYNTAPLSIKHAADDPKNDEYLKLIDMAPDFTSTVPTVYSIGKSQTITRAIPTNSPLRNGNSFLSCKDAAQRANLNAAAYQTWAAANVELADTLVPGTSTETTEDKTSCVIEGVGWLVCPVITFLGTLNDAAFGFLNNWLEIPARIFTDPATKGVWETFRNIANIAFVMAFLIIIYSQLTGAGISNYGIKKLLPKLILTAILVNASFIICSLLVDLSNIVGGSLYQILTSVDVGGNTTEPGALSSIWTTTLSAVLTGGAIVAILALIIFAPMSLLAFALVIMILVARQAFAILLVVISPLAFVAYLLPNTEHLFKKWWKAFSAILMVYVIIGALFGASTLASKILLSVSQSDNADSATLKIVSAAIMAVPLFAVPALLKGAMAAAGGVGNSIAKLQDRANKSASASGKKRFNDSAPGQFLQYRKSESARKRALSRSGISSGTNKNPLNWKRNVGARVMKPVNNSRLSGKFGDRLAAGGAELEAKMWDEEVAGQEKLITISKNMTNDQMLSDLASGKGGAAYQAALGAVIMKRDHRESHLKAIEIMRKRAEDAEDGSQEESVVLGVQKQMYHDGKANMPWAVGDQAKSAMEQGNFGKKGHFGHGVSLGDQMETRAGTHLTAETLARLNPDELKSLHKRAAAGSLGPAELASFRKAITDLRASDTLKTFEKPNATGLYDEVLNDTYSYVPGAKESTHYDAKKVF